MRSEYCGLISRQHLNQTITVYGWVHRRRDHGGVIFIDLRDREGLVQVVCNPGNADMFKVASTVRNEYCLRITGVVTERVGNTVNANLKSGKIEVVASAVEVLNASSTLMSSTLTSDFGIIRKNPEVGFGVVGTYTLQYSPCR